MMRAIFGINGWGALSYIGLQRDLRYSVMDLIREFLLPDIKQGPVS